MAKSKEYEMAIKIAGQVEQSFKNSMGLTQRQLSSIARQAAQTSASAHNLGSGFRDANKVIDTFGSGAKKALKTVAKAAAVTTAEVGGIAAASIKVGAEFEAQMSTVASISGATGDDLESLTEKAKKLGETTSFSATEAGQAMEYMAMAGWNTEQMLDGIDGIMNLAAASGEELGTVSDIVTDAMTAFGMKADEAATFSDVLAKTAASANTNVGMMGETFQYVAPVAGALGYNVKDTAVAIGLMANSGIKASTAGTSLRSWMSRMSAPTDQVATAMEKLGISLTDSKGNMKSLDTVMRETRKAFDGLTKSQKSQYASALAGKTGMSGLLAIVNSSEQDFEKLTEAINDSTGAAQEMADIKLDNLQGDVTLFKSAMSGLGIEIYEQLEEPLRDGVKGITEIVSATTNALKNNKIVEKAAKILASWIDSIKKGAPTAIRQLGEMGEAIASFAQPFLKLAGWMLDHPNVVQSTLVGIGTAIISVKLASKVYEVVGAFGALAGILTNPFAAAILAVGAALGVGAGIAYHMKKCAEEAKNANLDKHFGNISLSIEELQDAANRILDDGSLTALNTALEEFGKVDGISDGIKDTLSSLNRMNWEVSIGLDLTDDEKTAYRDDITSYIQDTQKLIKQKRYALSLSFDLLTGEDSELGKNVDTFLGTKEAELETLGKKLQKTVNKAFDDGLLTIDEEEKIRSIQQQMATISEGIAQSDYNASLEIIAGEYSGGNLDADTFKNLQKELSDKVTEASESYKEALKESIAALDYQLQSGDITQAEYDKGVDELWNGYRQKVSEAEAKATEFSLNTIMGQYSEEVKQASDNFDQIMKNYMMRETDWTNSAALMWDGFVSQFDGELVSSDTEDALNDLLKQLEPSETQMEQLAKQYQDAGKEIPQAIVDGLNQIEMLKAYAGDEGAIWTLIQQGLLDSGEYTEMLNKVKEAGGYIPDEIQAGLKDRASTLQNETKATVSTALEAGVKEAAANKIDANVKINTNTAETNSALKTEIDSIRERMRNILSNSTSVFDMKMKLRTQVQNDTASNSGAGIAHNAKGSIITKPTLSWFAEEGPEAAIPLDGSGRAKELWKTAGSILGIYKEVPGEASMATQAAASLQSETSKAEKSISALDKAGDTSNNNNITYAPQITIQGNASKQDLDKANEDAQLNFERMMEKYLRNQGRLAF